MNHIAEYLSDGERLAGIRYGAALEMADRGMSVGGFDRAVKVAQAKVPQVNFGDVLKTSLIFGVPIGTLWYVMDRAVNKGSKKSNRLRGELDYYNRVAHEMRNRFKYGRVEEEEE